MLVDSYLAEVNRLQAWAHRSAAVNESGACDVGRTCRALWDQHTTVLQQGRIAAVSCFPLLAVHSVLAHSLTLPESNECHRAEKLTTSRSKRSK